MKAELKTYQLGRRLGSGVNVLVDENRTNFKPVPMVVWAINTRRNEPRLTVGLKNDLLMKDGDMSWFKPVLRPLSHLTIPITHNGESFVPMDRLGWVKSYGDDGMGELVYCQYGESPKTTVNVIEYLDDLQKLIEWHFVLDEPEGTWISVDELDTNPYEN